jgi:uncharacterized protein
MSPHPGEDRGSVLSPASARPQFHLLAKPTGAVCNLDCTYCFFLSKEMLYPGSRFRMADDLLEAYLRQLTEAHAAAPEVVMAWQGGEPTMMGLGFFRRSVELAERHRRPGQKIMYTIQTNGILLDDDWAAFFAEHGFLVGLSIDGPAQIHDTYRVDKGGKGSFHRVMKGLAALQRHGVEWNTLTTVHARTRTGAGRSMPSCAISAGRGSCSSSPSWSGPRRRRSRPPTPDGARACATARCIPSRETWSPIARSPRRATADS